MSSANPLLQDPELPYGVPDSSRISAEHYVPAFEEAFRRHRAEVDAIAESTEPATFDNTIVALERSGELLDRVSRAFHTVSSAHATPEIQEIDEWLAPAMSEHRDAITLGSGLYRRIADVHERRGGLGLTDEQSYLVEQHYRKMTHAGAALDDEAKTLLTDINSRLSVLVASFEKNLLADTNALAVVVDDADELEGLSPAELASAARTADERGLPGRFVLTLPLFTGHPALASLRRRDVRRRIMTASRARGTGAGEHDNSAVILEIVRLRARRAALLGHASHADYITSHETAGSPQAVRDLLFQLAPAAARNAQREKAALQSTIDQEDSPFELEASDWAYYTERVRSATLDIDSASLRPWFAAERVLRDGVFFAAEQLYGVTFAERHDIPAYHPDARVFEVSNADGSPLGLFVLDLYTRDTKRGGAWMNSIVAQSRLRGTAPVVVNNLNVPKPAGDAPALLTLDEVNTLFHEFGHALHGLFATVTYPSLAGTNVRRDFVEFPSQVNEMWVFWPEILDNYARHVETGEPLPADVVARLRSSETFNQGFATSEYLAAAWLDQAWHSLTPEEAERVDDVAAFEAAALAEIGLDDPAVPSRYSSTYFAHIFAGDYSAGYYSYIWSEVLDADTVAWFEENGGLQRANGDRFRDRLLGVGGSKDPLDAYRDFRGRDAEIAPLLARRGLG